MTSSFTRKIALYETAEIVKAREARFHRDSQNEFKHLERAHILGQESTYWHTRVHFLMLLYALRNQKSREVLGQIFRLIGAATKTVFGLVPRGNTGGANVSPFKEMPIPADLAVLIEKAKSAS
ncbi:DUF3703 domain-containing protein [uncultured Zhongshania sp.]|uniref:DUF3703 domain-containing protein n=1 Tax=uncultured Zhongshania sp. TaxID=1642288 RepID=UPI0030D6D7A6|tara:strand:+ start:797 stop:1165 length:369 start_codon:yes stop_codon:yes gene_type:complete